MTNNLLAITTLSLLFLSSTVSAQNLDAEDCENSLQCKSSWIGLSRGELAAIFEFGEEYKAFIHRARTELTFVNEAISFAEANGFRALTATTRLQSGMKIYEVNRDRTISLFVIGEQPLQNGFHVIGAHIDSPRLELKGPPRGQRGSR